MYFSFTHTCTNNKNVNAVYSQNRIERWTKGCILPFPKKGDLGLAKNYRGITLTSIAAKIYNALLRNRIEPKIDNILRKNQNGFWRNRSTVTFSVVVSFTQRYFLEAAGMGSCSDLIAVRILKYALSYDELLCRPTIAWHITLTYANLESKIRSQSHVCSRALYERV